MTRFTQFTQFTQFTLISAVSTAALLVSACTQDSPNVSRELHKLEQTAPSTVVRRTHQKPTSERLAATQKIATQSAIGASSADMAMEHEESITPSATAFVRITPEQITPPRNTNGEQYAELLDNRTTQTVSEPVSTFSIDVDTGAYSNIRRFLQHGQLPPSDAVRVEEMLNYFSYDYATTATPEQPFSVTTELGATPWNDNTQLMHIGLKGYMPDSDNPQAANLVFLIDVSGSMNSPDKLGLLKSSISLLAHELDAQDTVSIVVYAGSSGTVLEPTAGNQHATIDRALSRLTAGGSTNGADGIQLAYQLAAENFDKNGINRVILATDGDFNVGISDTDDLKKLIKKKRASGIALTTLGFGTGNYNDHLMEQLADVGDGAYAYIDTLGEARKVLVDELQSTLLTIAKDVKIQVEFNPAMVSEYRLIGYTNRILANEDFNNDKVDAGDIGAGHTVTALYEVALTGQGGERHTPRRYGHYTLPENSSLNGELAEVRLRYKLPGHSDSLLISQVVKPDRSQKAGTTTSDNFRFSASVAAFGQLLRDDHAIDSFGYEDTRKLASSARGDDPFGYRAEFIRLLDTALGLDRIQRAANGERTSDEG